MKSHQVKTFENQSSLPRLPVPSLEHTLKLYAKSVQPYFESQEEYNAYLKTIQDFQNGLGKTLQQRLVAYEKTQPNSWLEAWWLKLAYLGWRDSVLINSNWYILTSPHPETPKHLEKGLISGYTDFQLHRAAGFISNFVDYNESLNNQTLVAEYAKTTPLCMNQYKNVFGITRVPKPEVDVLVGSYPCTYKHIIVLAQDQIFSVPVYDPQTGSRLSIAAIEGLLKQITASVNNIQKQPAIGLLSAQHRDAWAKHHAHLLSLGNQNTFYEIETALFAVALDHRPLEYTVDALAKNVFHGYDARNRWFDKSVTIVVTNDGRIGVNGEHSPCDALVPALVVDYAREREPAKDAPGSVLSTSAKPKHLTWKVDGSVSQFLKEAQAAANALIKDSDVHVLHFKSYGGNFIKKFGKVSPDAYVQMCLQLTFYRLHKKFAPVYETAATRKYLHGRTETVRSFSSDQKEFVLLFESSSKNPIEKYDAFKKACTSHVQYLQVASDAHGCDRHLLGLRLCLQNNESHPIFTHPIFGNSSRWLLSTSALFSGERMYGTGFGAVYPEGYGMNYMVASDMIKVGVESKFSCKETSTVRFIETLTKSFKDVAAMCEQVHSEKGVAKSKL